MKALPLLIVGLIVLIVWTIWSFAYSVGWQDGRIDHIKFEAHERALEEQRQSHCLPGTLEWGSRGSWNCQMEK